MGHQHCQSRTVKEMSLSERVDNEELRRSANFLFVGGARTWFTLHAIAMKTMPDKLLEVMNTSIKVVNFIRLRAKNH